MKLFTLLKHKLKSLNFKKAYKDEWNKLWDKLSQRKNFKSFLYSYKHKDLKEEDFSIEDMKNFYLYEREIFTEYREYLDNLLNQVNSKEKNVNIKRYIKSTHSKLLKTYKLRKEKLSKMDKSDPMYDDLKNELIALEKKIEKYK